MSMFAAQTTETIPIPFAPGHTATIRALTGREIDLAQAEHLKATVAGQSTHGWAGAFQRRLAQGIATPADADRALADPLGGYDRHTIVKAGVLSWTLADPVLSPEAIEGLTDDPLEWFAIEIMKRSKPALFQTVAEAETERKNASGASSAP